MTSVRAIAAVDRAGGLMRTAYRLFLLTLIAAAISSPGRAATLTDVISGQDFNQITTLASPFILEMQRTISRSIDFPATATTPGFIYKYNPDLDLYERSSGSLGPSFLDRAETIGKGHFDVGASYLFANFATFDGDSLDGLTRVQILNAAGIVTVANTRYDTLDIATSGFYLSSTYGLASHWDVNVLLPIFFTDVTSQRTLTNVEGAGTLTEPALTGSKVGPGDLQLRTKYQWLDGENLKSAAGFALRIPTGNQDNFQGVGLYTLTPVSVTSYRFGPHDVHFSAGFEFDAGDIEQSRLTYGLGGSFEVVRWLTANLDVIGTSMVQTDSATEDVDAAYGDLAPFIPELLGNGIVGVEPLGRDMSRVNLELPRRDFVDIAVGAKFSIYGNLVGFLSAIVPLTDDGVRAPVIPAGGVEMTF